MKKRFTAILICLGPGLLPATAFADVEPEAEIATLPGFCGGG